MKWTRFESITSARKASFCARLQFALAFQFHDEYEKTEKKKKQKKTARTGTQPSELTCILIASVRVLIAPVRVLIAFVSVLIAFVSILIASVSILITSVVSASCLHLSAS